MKPRLFYRALLCIAATLSIGNAMADPFAPALHADTSAFQAASDSHKHAFKKTEIAATCTTPGELRYQCACGLTFLVNQLPATGHTYGEYRLTQIPTATADGMETAICLSCSHSISRTYICQHQNTTTIIQEATAELVGCKITICDLCGLTLTKTTMAKLEPMSLDVAAPIPPFAHLPDHLRTICEEIAAAVATAYDAGEASGNETILRDLQLTFSETQRIDYALRIYYGNCNGVYEAFTFSFSKTSNEGPFTVDIYTDLPLSAQLEQQRREVSEAVEKYLVFLSPGTREEQALQIFSALSTNTTYNAKCPNAIDLIKTKEGSCNAYAILFRQICLSAGIPCDMIVGYTKTGSYHAWNQIETEDGSYRYYDIPYWQHTQDGVYCGGKEPLHTAKAYNSYSEQ